MYEEYAVANKIELGKTYMWAGIEPSIAQSISELETVFNPIDNSKASFVKTQSELDALLYQQKVLVKEFPNKG